MLKHVAYRSTSSLGRASTDMTCRSSSMSPDTMSLKGDLPSPDLSLKRPSVISQDAMSLNNDPMADNISLKGDMSLKNFSHDTVSLHSTISFTSLATGRLSSRCSSTASLNEQQTTPVKVYLRSLRPDFEYKTMKLSTATTCRQLIVMLLTKFRLKHRDPNLFFVTMEVTVRASGGGAPTRRLLVLDDQARPAELQQCRPRGDARFSIGVRRGGLLRIHDSILMSGSQYKSLLVSYRTTAEELVQLLLNCYGNKENPMHYSVHEVNKNPYTDRPLRPDECPLSVQSEWPRATRQNYAFVLRRNVSYALSLKSRVSWRRSLDQSSTDTESEHEDHNTTITSLLSSSSVSSALSISSEGSLSSNGSSSSSGVSSTCSSALASPVASPIKKPSQVSPIASEVPSSRTALTSKPPAPPPASAISHSKLISSSHSTPTSAPTPVPRTILNTSTPSGSVSAKPVAALVSTESHTVPSSPPGVSSSSSCNGAAITTVTTSTPKSSSISSSSSSSSCSLLSAKASSSTSSSPATTNSVSPREAQVPPVADGTVGAALPTSTPPPPPPPSPPPPPVPMRRTSCCPNYENCFYI
ncbi:polycomb protein Pcl-like [Macrobrachium nipponense]|uniref:polycomb protein Pcl-like n=1 Tax=Macrobrachium nipponense TaxID=159736 RepID=UPI0030C88239